MFFRTGSTVPLPFSWGRSACYSDGLHDFSATISECYKDVYINSFFPHTVRFWNSLPIECFKIIEKWCLLSLYVYKPHLVCLSPVNSSKLFENYHRKLNLKIDACRTMTYMWSCQHFLNVWCVQRWMLV